MILKAAWLIPVTSPPIRDGYIAIDGGRISGMGSAAELSASAKGIEDLGDVVLTPGLVNPHTHLELTCYAGQLPPAPFWKWIGGLIPLRAAPGQVERERQAVIDGAWQSLRAGVTCVGDISRRNVAWPALKSLPIRKVCFVELLSLADHPPRDPRELREEVSRIEEDELLTAGITPHAPYTVAMDQVRAAIGLAGELERPWTMHLAETREEVAFLRGEPGALGRMFERLLDRCGVTAPCRLPGAYLDTCCPDGRSGSLAHMNYVEDHEFARLAKNGHVVIYCPRSHRFFGHSPHPFARMRAAGVRVAVGTDSVASNESLSLLDELRFVHAELPDAPPPGELLRMATLDGARALGLQDAIGSLEIGKQADLAAFPCAGDVTDPVGALIEQPVPAAGVWVAGRLAV